jgi:hypothetical protein
MPTPRIAEKDLLSPVEMALFTLSNDSGELTKRSPAQLRDKIARARDLRDRAQDMYHRQVGQTRAVTGNKRGYTGLANERTRQKGEVLRGVVDRLSQARTQQLAAT